MGVKGSTLVNFVTDLVTFGGQGLNFGDLCNRFSDLWGFRGSTLVIFVTDLVTSGWSGGSTLVTFVTDFVTFGGSGGQFW